MTVRETVHGAQAERTGRGELSCAWTAWCVEARKTNTPSLLFRTARPSVCLLSFPTRREDVARRMRTQGLPIVGWGPRKENNILNPPPPFHITLCWEGPPPPPPNLLRFLGTQPSTTRVSVGRSERCVLRECAAPAGEGIDSARLVSALPDTPVGG